MTTTRWSDPNSSFWVHLQAFRTTLLLIGITIGLGLLLCLVFYDSLFSLLKKPLHQEQALTVSSLLFEKVENHTDSPFIYHLPPDVKPVFPLPENVALHENHDVKLGPHSAFLIERSNLLLLSPLEGPLCVLKVALWSSVILTSPLWLLFLLHFIFPGLYSSERRVVLIFLLLSTLFMGSGLVFCSLITLPLANDYLQNFSTLLGTNAWSLSSYIDYTLILLFGHALAFEAFLIILILIHLGIIRTKHLSGKRRFAIVLAFILGAIFTPPDVLTQILLAIPLIIFFELSILYAHIRSFYLNK